METDKTTIDRIKESGIESWKKQVAERVYKTKVENRKKKFEALKTEVNEKLHELISIYFNNYGLDEIENKNTFDILNQEWQELCKKLRLTAAKVIVLDYKAFEKAVETNLNMPDFQEAIAKMKADAEKEPPAEPEVKEPLLDVSNE